MRVASRQSPEDLKCDIEVGPASDSQRGSTREIKIEMNVLSPSRLS